MRRHPLYLAFGLLLIGGFAYAESRGWTLGRATEGRSAAGPRSVRENPGSSRSVYVGGASRYRGGK
jgi:hypothetical protein